MSVWAIADLHLSFGVPEKTMEVFGPEWVDYAEKLKSNWLKSITPDDLVLIAGDISWAMRLEEAKVDLDWIDSLPGTKVLIKGNHDYWWSSPSKTKSILPPSLHLIQNNAFNWGGYSIGGARLWDTDEYRFDTFIDFRETSAAPSQEEKPDTEKIFKRELERLELSLKALDQSASKRLVMTHYPPIGADLQPSKGAALLEKYRVDVCVFGHLHSVKREVPLFGSKRGIRYYLTSCDYLDFKPIKIEPSIGPN
ncbi:MAG: metallophosphoesterase [Chlamydiales bacterium]|nr:metallophosphoesterase [Chlamydiales bacterium]